MIAGCSDIITGEFEKASLLVLLVDGRRKKNIYFEWMSLGEWWGKGRTMSESSALQPVVQFCRQYHLKPDTVRKALYNNALPGERRPDGWYIDTQSSLTRQYLKKWAAKQRTGQ